ncbi:HD family phosphohydrolase [Sunxiuqinia sp. A32]|uniref:HD family phosphohydrolase n=1 Tax=Sunxiuqinia sp. A32 TaxID=3461496 RepID=UPI004045CFEF
MKKLLTRIARYYHFFFIAFVFLASIVLLYWSIPGESRFKYEFQKNAPWRHETLVAPFNFAILKTDEEIKTEKDSLQKEFVPYLVMDTITGQNFVNELSIELSVFKDSIPKINVLTQYLSDIYKDGIYAQSIETSTELAGRDAVNLIRNKIVTRIPTERLYSLKSAYKSMNDSARVIFGDKFNDFTSSINLISFIQTNVSYDQERNDQELEKLLASVSVSLGMVQAGERVIFKGDIITPDRFLVLESLKKSYETKRGQDIDRYLIILGKAILIAACMLIMAFYLAYFRPEIFNQKRRLSFIFLLIILMVFVSRFINDQDFINLYVVPIAILPILLRIFFDSRTAIFALLVTSILIGYFAPNNYEYIFLNLVTGIIAVFSLDKLHKRSHLVLTALWVFVSYTVIFLSLSMVQEGNIETIQWRELQWFGVNALLVLLAYPLIYIFEKLFGFVSDVTLMELADTNQPLLRKLSQDAPGTFQHSLQVANLAEEVIIRIGGNPFLVRAGALYHDIGKTNQPAYFIENQAAGMNPHQQLDHKSSAKIIIDHVTYGEKLAHKHKLPEMLIEFITSHHGTTQAKYFYTMHKNENPGKEVDIKEFTYPGPPPKSKETAVVMLTDGIEAAARALKEKTYDNLKALIENMVAQKLESGQMENADLTLRDIKVYKETILEKLMNIYHIRIEYPE